MLSEVPGQIDSANPRAAGAEFLDHRPASVTAAIVDQNQLQRREGFAQNGLDAFREQFQTRFRVVNRDYD